MTLYRRLKNCFKIKLIDYFHYYKYKDTEKQTKSLFKILTNNLVNDPLRNSAQLETKSKNKKFERINIPSIGVLMLIGPKDINTFHLSINSVIKMSLNGILKITLITPSNFVAEVKNKTEFYFKKDQIKFVILTDEEVLKRYPLVEITVDKYPKSRQYWYRQQILKLIALFDYKETTLLIDSDLILLKKRLWVNFREQQVIYITDNTMPLYKVNAEKFYNAKFPYLEFTTHCFLVQKKLLNYLIKNFGNTETYLLRYLNVGFTKLSLSSISDYQMLASAQILLEPRVIFFGKQSLIYVKKSALNSKVELAQLENKYSSFDAMYLIHK